MREMCPDCVTLKDFMKQKEYDPLTEQEAAHVAYQLYSALFHS